MLKHWSVLLLVVGLVAGCGAATTSPSVPSSAQIAQPAPTSEDAMIQAALDSAPNDSGWTFAAAPLAVAPKVKTPKVLLNFVATGYPADGLPCFTCVKKVTTKDNVGLPGPFNYVFHGDAWQYIISYTDISFKGNCEVAIAITSGKKVIDKFATSADDNKPEFYYLYWDTRRFPAFSGLATVTADLSCPGTGKQKTSAPIVFE
jgi:hypothetical protein